MIIVLDSNVIVAAFAAHGLCQSVFELCLDQHEIAASAHLLDGVSTALQKKLKVPEKKANEVVRFLENHGRVFKPAPMQKPVCRDPSDDRILELARESEAAFIVTGDEDLLMLERYWSIPIITPRQLWERLKQPEPG
jgi:putative PIN family toxin of toxin-antitoxin system